MGWTYCTKWDSKLALLAYLRGGERWGSEYKLLKSAVVGSRHWYVGESPDGRRFIGLDMMQSGRGDGWGYKDMDESCGPVAVDCPLSLLDMVAGTEPVGFAAAWREKVRQYHERKKTRPALSPGMVVTYGGHQYRLDSAAGPRRGWLVHRESDGRLFRMNTRQLAVAVEHSSMGA